MNLPLKLLCWIQRKPRRAAEPRTTIVPQLTRFREAMAAGIAPEPWPHLHAPFVLVLADLCDALALDAQDKAQVLGPAGQEAIAELLESRVTLRQPPEVLNDPD